MIPTTPAQKLDALEALRDHHFHMRIASKILQSDAPLGEDYLHAMRGIKRTGKPLDKYAIEPKPKRPSAKAETKDLENQGAAN